MVGLPLWLPFVGLLVVHIGEFLDASPKLGPPHYSLCLQSGGSFALDPMLFLRLLLTSSLQSFELHIARMADNPPHVGDHACPPPTTIWYNTHLVAMTTSITQWRAVRISMDGSNNFK